MRPVPAGPKQRLVFVDRLPVTLVRLRPGIPHAALAESYAVDRSTVSGALREVSPLPGPLRRLKSGVRGGAPGTGRVGAEGARDGWWGWARVSWKSGQEKGVGVERGSVFVRMVC
ncbi:transposase family protein [Streptomyces sp. NPDC048508]|uniref:transposase family protein n=1 Tax=Streptomyces sp. NPDC048508 TaxID=3365561 RepID=UPI003718BA58